MAEHTSSGRRPHYHRGRRGMDRRGTERRSPQTADTARPSGEQVDVEQLMRDIRSRISQRHGLDLSPQQIQDLAGRRLEAILDPRTVNPTLFEQLRRSAGIVPEVAPAVEETSEADTAAVYDTGGGFVGFMRRLLRPVLAPLLSALQRHDRQNREAQLRAAEITQRQTEWNALHYQVLQRLVTEVSRASIEVQSYAGRIESLSARVDFNDRRVRALENAPPAQRGHRPETTPVQAATAPTAAEASAPDTAASANSGFVANSDAPRRRRRRRRGRRTPAGSVESAGLTQPDGPDDSQELEGTEDDLTAEIEPAERSATETPTSAPPLQVPEPRVDPPAEAEVHEPERSPLAAMPAPAPPPDDPGIAPVPAPDDPGPPER